MSLSTEKFAQIAKALSDPIRIKILDLIQAGYEQLGASPPVACCSDGVCVCDIQEQMNMAQSKVSYHLRELKNAGLLHETKVGKWNFYAINYTTMKLFRDELQHRYHREAETVGTKLDHSESNRAGSAEDYGDL
jgi:ArsR family transcriptional regulator, arsenate/arsenite/antimonite-responsive transcriptional repressor